MSPFLNKTIASLFQGLIKMASAEILTSIRHPDDEFDIDLASDSISDERDVFQDFLTASSSASSTDVNVASTSSPIATVASTTIAQGPILKNHFDLTVAGFQNGGKN